MAPRKDTGSIERENLEAHVELCAERYEQLKSRLADLDEKVEKLSNAVIDIRDCMTRSLNNTNQVVNNRFLAVSASAIGILVTAVLGLILSKI